MDAAMYVEPVRDPVAQPSDRIGGRQLRSGQVEDRPAEVERGHRLPSTQRPHRNGSSASAEAGSQTQGYDRDPE